MQMQSERLQEYIGMLSESEMARVDKALAISVALEKTKATDLLEGLLQEYETAE